MGDNGVINLLSQNWRDGGALMAVDVRASLARLPGLLHYFASCACESTPWGHLGDNHWERRGLGTWEPA